MSAVKGVKFGYEHSAELAQVLSLFRDMVNDAIRICIAENISGRLNLRNRIYREFIDRYSLASQYPYSVAEIAWSIVKKHRRWHRVPVARHPMMKLDSSAYTVNDGVMSIAYRQGRNGQRINVRLKSGEYQRLFMEDRTLSMGSVTITADAVVVAFTKNVATAAPVGKVAFDINEKSLVSSDGERYDLSDIARLQTEYGQRRAEFSQKHNEDRRLIKKVSKRSRQRERIRQRVHAVANAVVKRAKDESKAIVMEKLTHIRKSQKKGNGRGNTIRRRINRWPFSIMQNAIVYKAAWEGVEVQYVSPSWTSKKCSVCGKVNRKLGAEKVWQCPCGATHDRDFNAAMNIWSRSNPVCLPVTRAGAGG